MRWDEVGWMVAAYLGGTLTVFVARPFAEWLARLLGR